MTGVRRGDLARTGDQGGDGRTMSSLSAALITDNDAPAPASLARTPHAIEKVTVGLEAELPDGIEPVYVLIPPHTDLAAVGYPLDDGGMTRGFVDDDVCFMEGDVDKELTDLLAFDGAHFIDGSVGTFLAIRYQIEPAGDNIPPRAWRLAGHGTKHNSSLRMTEVGPYVVVVRSDDGHLTVFTPAMTARGQCHRIDPDVGTRTRTPVGEGRAGKSALEQQRVAAVRTAARAAAPQAIEKVTVKLGLRRSFLAALTRKYSVPSSPPPTAYGRTRASRMGQCMCSSRRTRTSPPSATH